MLNVFLRDSVLPGPKILSGREDFEGSDYHPLSAFIRANPR
jgi:hypothetical protein